MAVSGDTGVHHTLHVDRYYELRVLNLIYCHVKSVMIRLQNNFRRSPDSFPTLQVLSSIAIFPTDPTGIKLASLQIVPQFTLPCQRTFSDSSRPHQDGSGGSPVRERKSMSLMQYILLLGRSDIGRMSTLRTIQQYQKSLKSCDLTEYRIWAQHLVPDFN
jgi:hypothetical protein